MADRPRILITAAGGQLGRLTIDRLLKLMPAGEIATTVRNPAVAAELAALGVKSHVADYDDPATLDAPFEGIEKVMVISTNAMGKRVPQHKNMVDAAKKAGVKLLAYTSCLHPETSPTFPATEHRPTEAYIRESGLPYVMLRNGWYTENYAARMRQARDWGVLLGSAGKGRISSADRGDFADAAVAVLAGPKDYSNQALELAGDVAYDLEGLAATISKVSGKTVPYKDLSPEDFKAALIEKGVAEAMADMAVGGDKNIASNVFLEENQLMSTIIGHPTLPLEASVKKFFTAG